MQPKYLTRDEDYRWKHGIDYRENPHLYHSGRGQQGVTICEPYKSEIGQYWRFKTETIARESATRIYAMFLDYLEQDDFIGADMCKKFIHMGFTRARRYANHKSGRKYAVKPPYYHTGNRGGAPILPQEPDALTNEKAKAASIFKAIRDKAAYDPKYKDMRQLWRSQE